MSITSLHFDFPIKRLLLDTTGSVMGVECWQQQDEQKTLYHLDLSTRNSQKSFLQLPIFETVVAISKRYVITQHYPDPQMPISEGMFVFDWENKQKILSFESAQIVSVTLGFVAFCANENSTIQYFSLETGAILSEPGLSKAAVTPLYPSFFVTENAEFEAHAQWILFNTKNEPYQHIDYLELDKIKIYNYYVKSEFVSQYLYICHDNIELYHAKVSANIKGIHLDAFFVIGDVAVILVDLYRIDLLDISKFRR